jgi:hypothetical protein
MLVQKLTVFLLKAASAMVFLLRSDVLRHSIELTWAYGKDAISALPEKAAIPSLKRFDPFCGRESATPPTFTNSAPRSRQIVAR